MRGGEKIFRVGNFYIKVKYKPTSPYLLPDLVFSRSQRHGFYNANIAMDHLRRLLFLPAKWELRYCIMRLGQITLGAAVVQFLSNVALQF